MRREIAPRVQYGAIFSAIHGYATGELDAQLERTRKLMSRAASRPEIQMLLVAMWSVESSCGESRPWR